MVGYIKFSHLVFVANVDCECDDNLGPIYRETTPLGVVLVACPNKWIGGVVTTGGGGWNKKLGIPQCGGAQHRE